MARRSSILASDADRETVAERLRQAATEGRILAHELEERLARALRARTYGELDVLVSDLPRSGTPARRRSTALGLARSHPIAAVVVLLTLTLAICIAAAVVAFSGVWLLFLVVAFARLGPWSHGRRGSGRGPGGGAGRVGYRYDRSGGYGSGRGRSAYWLR